MVNKELIVHKSDEYENISIALLEDGALEEISRVGITGSYSVGDIYLGKVHKIMGGLNAAFINIGGDKDAFIHYLDLGVHFKSYAKILDTLAHRRIFSFPDFPKQKELPKEGEITSVLKSGDAILVQITKEPINSKGPRVSTDISLTGRNIVLRPFDRKVAISQKIKSAEERKRLKDIVREVLPENFGVIIRTASEGADYDDLQSDIKELVAKWQVVLDNIQKADAKTPSLILNENSRIMTILRDMLNDSFSSIVTDDNQMHNEIKEYIRKISQGQEKIVKLHKSATPIFDEYDVTRQIKGLFGKIVPFKRKSYMVIEQTEALHVIDINSGPRVGNATNQEEVAFEVNSNAVEQIARQLRLRDMGGIIVIDFIDMYKNENRQELYNMMREAMKKDRAKHTILPLSKFCLMQITRQRVRPATKIENNEACPTCKGTGKITSSVLYDIEIVNNIAAFISKYSLKYLKIELHPFLASYFTKGLISKRVKLMLKHRVNIKIESNESIGYIDAKYYDKSGRLLSVDSIVEDIDNETDSEYDE